MPGGPLNLNSTNLPRPLVTAGILPFRENSHGRAGNRTRDLMISSQRLRPLDHEAGRRFECCSIETNTFLCILFGVLAHFVYNRTVILSVVGSTFAFFFLISYGKYHVFAYPMDLTDSLLRRICRTFACPVTFY